MKREVLNRFRVLIYQKKSIQFLIIIIIVAYFASYISRILPKGGVWNNHMADGLLLIKGIVPEIPAYPMWGYSFLGGILMEYITILQGIFMMVVCFYWYRSILVYITSSNTSSIISNIIVNPIFVAAMFVPFIFLSLSYYSNSITYIIIFFCTWILYNAVEKEREIGYYAICGLLVGFAYNFRSEILILGILFFFALFSYGIIKQQKCYYFKMSAVFLMTLFLTILPWMIYTNFVVKEPLCSSTNGGAVMYLGLGILHNNPWDVVYSDHYVGEIANDNNLGSAWSNDANKFFKNKYLQSIKKHPKSFVKRVFLGWRYMLTQGVYFPYFRNLFSLENNRDEILFDYLNERFKLKFGLNADKEDLEKYIIMGITSNDLSFRHYLILSLEYILRFVYMILFIALLSLAFLLSLKNKYKNFITYIFLAFIVFLLFTAGFIQTQSRFTTLLMPISLVTIIVLIYQPNRHTQKNNL